MNAIIDGLTFFTSLMLVLGAIITTWIFARSSASRRQLKPFLFGAGLFVITSTFMILDITKIMDYPIWIFVYIVSGYILVALSVFRRKYHYLYLLTAIFPFLLPFHSPWMLLAPLPAFAIAFWVNNNYDMVWLPEDGDGSSHEKKFHRGWAFLFTILPIISVVDLYQMGGYKLVSVQTISVVDLALKVVASILLFSLIYHSLAVVKKDRAVLTIILGFVAIVSLVTFALGNLLNSYYETELVNTVRSNAKLYKLVAETKYPEGELASMLQNKDASLNDLADSILAQTGIHGTFFYGDERVAASESITGKGRFIGTKTGDTQAIATVLGQGQSYQGKTVKSGVVLMAGYEPIIKNDGTVVGMVGVSKSLESINTLQDTVFRRMIFAAILAVIIVFVATPLKVAGNNVISILKR